MKPKLLTGANHNTMLNLGCDCGMCFLTHLKLELSKILGIPKRIALIKVWFVARVHRMRRKFDNHWVEYRNSIDLMNHPSNMEIGLCWC